MSGAEIAHGLVMVAARNHTQAVLNVAKTINALPSSCTAIIAADDKTRKQYRKRLMISNPNTRKALPTLGFTTDVPVITDVSLLRRWCTKRPQALTPGKSLLVISPLEAAAASVLESERDLTGCCLNLRMVAHKLQVAIICTVTGPQPGEAPSLPFEVLYRETTYCPTAQVWLDRPSELSEAEYQTLMASEGHDGATLH